MRAYKNDTQINVGLYYCLWFFFFLFLLCRSLWVDCGSDNLTWSSFFSSLFSSYLQVLLSFFLPAIGCLPLPNRSTLCLSISFDNDQLRTILIPTTTASIESSFADGTRIVLRISLPTSKSNANNNPLARRNLIVSFCWVCSSGDLRNILKNANNAVPADIAMIIPAAMSIPNVR